MLLCDGYAAAGGTSDRNADTNRAYSSAITRTRTIQKWNNFLICFNLKLSLV